RIGRDDGGYRVEEGKRAGIQPPRDRARERLGGERARRNDAGGLEPGDLAPHHGDRRMAGDPIVHSLGECDAVYGERRTTGPASPPPTTPALSSPPTPPAPPPRP